MRVLIVEDDARIAADIAEVLQASGFRAEVAVDGEEAWFRGGIENYDVIVLDLGLPRLDGLTVLRRWRGEGVTTPVLVLSARGTWIERVEGIDAGADDYLPKPFEMAELVARARALVRRSAGHPATLERAGPLALDLGRMSATLNGRPVSLTPLEFRLVSHLALHRGRPVPPTELLERLYGDDDSRESNAVEAVVARLRRKLGPDVIETRRGFGYLLADP
ncbi:response regulator transcription factor [uncultured Jannaschia sp.]|uniref:response regulator transcription factor n=1 Tax=uncultured Jannaschia sp. TaxID=293347 RepID=UPI0026356F7D|nr:response regulator transcription factor [uncultured Jannaschia sp.]